MASAYLSNPVLQGERARQRATDEQVPQALSGWRPTVVLRGDGGYEWGSTTVERRLPPPRDDITITDTNDADNTPARFAIGLSQPIFQGFRTVRETARAEANVAAGQQDLLAVEQEVLLDATAAYMDVVRDREIVALRQRNVGALSSSCAAPLRASTSARSPAPTSSRRGPGRASPRRSCRWRGPTWRRRWRSTSRWSAMRRARWAIPASPIWSRPASRRRWRSPTSSIRCSWPRPSMPRRRASRSASSRPTCCPAYRWRPSSAPATIRARGF
jgi:hypothetical protein